MAGGGAAAAAAIANAIKASGTIVKVEPEDFRTIINRQQEPLVVIAEGGFFNSKYKYLTSYRGLAFYAQTSDAVELPSRCEVIKAGKIWMP